MSWFSKTEDYPSNSSITYGKVEVTVNFSDDIPETPKKVTPAAAAASDSGFDTPENYRFLINEYASKQNSR